MGMFVYSSFIVIMVELLIDKDYLKGYVMLLLYFWEGINIVVGIKIMVEIFGVVRRFGVL